MVHKVGAKSSIILSLHLSRKELEAEAKKVCLELLPDWEDLTADDIEVSEISGGITNLLWKLAPKEHHSLQPVVVRVYGKQTDLIIDRSREESTLRQLNKANFGAQVLGKFVNGRIEAFLPMRPLKPEEMTTRAMAARIARRLRHFHNVDMEEPVQPSLFPTVFKWLEMARSLKFEDDAVKEKAHAFIDFDGYEQEIAAVQSAAQRLHPAACFAHNDLLAGNILVPNQEKAGEEAGEVQFIDFEYGAFSYTCYDFANHFCEYAGFECDYTRYPDREHIGHFVRHYMEEGGTAPVSDSSVEKHVVESNLFALASHQYWGTWAILQARYSPIEFDYMGYSKLRWDEYYRRKAEFLADVDKFIGAPSS